MLQCFPPPAGYEDNGELKSVRSPRGASSQVNGEARCLRLVTLRSLLASRNSIQVSLAVRQAGLSSGNQEGNWSFEASPRKRWSVPTKFAWTVQSGKITYQVMKPSKLCGVGTAASCDRSAVELMVTLVQEDRGGNIDPLIPQHTPKIDNGCFQRAGRN